MFRAKGLLKMFDDKRWESSWLKTLMTENEDSGGVVLQSAAHLPSSVQLRISIILTIRSVSLFSLSYFLHKYFEQALCFVLFLPTCSHLMNHTDTVFYFG